MEGIAQTGLASLAARRTGRLAGQVSWWLSERGLDAARWPANLARELPGRARRLGRAARDGLHAIPVLPPPLAEYYRSRPGRLRAVWALDLGARFFDLAGGPELAEFFLRGLTRATPLTVAEQAAAATLLGPAAIRWGEVRVAEGGVLWLIFARNGNRAFTTWHTVNMPLAGRHTRSHLDIVIHELVHVYQYERLGSASIVEALLAQVTAGYGYGGESGLQADQAAGRGYAYYNREQQAQIVQDFFTMCERGETTPHAGRHHGHESPAPRPDPGAPYRVCLAELWAGQI